MAPAPENPGRSSPGRAGDAAGDAALPSAAPANAAAGPELVLYSAPGCSLCEEALLQLEPLTRELGLRLRVVDISNDPSLEAAYRSRIPVGEVAGKIAFKYRVDDKRLRRLVKRTST